MKIPGAWTQGNRERTAYYSATNQAISHRFSRRILGLDPWVIPVEFLFEKAASRQFSLPQNFSFRLLDIIPSLFYTQLPWGDATVGPTEAAVTRN
jgi:hypothetical protein